MPSHLMLVVKTCVLALGPDRTVCVSLSPTEMQSTESHTSPTFGLEINEEETSGNFPWRGTSGPDYLLIYCLFTLRQTRRLP